MQKRLDALTLGLATFNDEAERVPGLIRAGHVDAAYSILDNVISDATDRIYALAARMGIRACGSDSGIYVVGANGGTPEQVLAGCAESFAWSPDGKSMAVAMLSGRDDQHEYSETVVLDVASRRRRVLAHQAGEPAWSPDGQRIVFTTDDALFISPYAGGAPKQLPASGNWPEWSPDGKEIAFTTASRIGIVRPNGSGLKYLTPTDSIGSPVPVHWLDGGGRLLSAGPKTQFAGEYLFTVDAAGGPMRRIVRPAGGSSQFAVAPVTGLIAYGDEDGNVHVVREDGVSKRKVGSGELGGWSPDGKRLAVAGGGLSVIDVETGMSRQVAGSAGNASFGEVPASWSKQGRLAFIMDAARCGGSD